MKKVANVVFCIACPFYPKSVQAFSAEIAAKMLVEREGGKGHAKSKSYRVDDKNIPKLA